MEIIKNEGLKWEVPKNKNQFRLAIKSECYILHRIIRSQTDRRKRQRGSTGWQRKVSDSSICRAIRDIIRGKYGNYYPELKNITLNKVKQYILEVKRLKKFKKEGLDNKINGFTNPLYNKSSINSINSLETVAFFKNT